MHVGSNELHDLAVDAFDDVNVGDGGALDEVGNRHAPARGRDLQIVEGADATRGRGIPHADVHDFVGGIGAVLAHPESVGDKLHRDADERDVCVVEGGLGTVDVEFPFDAGQRTRVVDVAQPGHPRVHVVPDCGYDRVEKCLLLGGELDLDRFADRRTSLGFPDLDRDAG